jgi:hypothetical protein
MGTGRIGAGDVGTRIFRPYTNDVADDEIVEQYPDVSAARRSESATPHFIEYVADWVWTCTGTGVALAGA